MPHDHTAAQEPRWKGKEYAFFCHRDCEYFPCHPTQDPDNFNCLFCYCPLYALGPDCGGNFTYKESGVKDCTRCSLPHRRENFGYVVSKVRELVRRMAEERKQGTETP